MADFSLQLTPSFFGTADYGDLAMVNGDLVLTAPSGSAGTDQTVQLVVQTLRLYLSEWFADLTAGIPFLQTVVAKGTSSAQIDAIIKDAVLSVDGVQSMTSYQGKAYPAERLYRVTFTIVTATGGTRTASVPIGA